MIHDASLRSAHGFSSTLVGGKRGGGRHIIYIYMMGGGGGVGNIVLLYKVAGGWLVLTPDLGNTL